MRPFHFHPKYGTTIESWPFAYQYPAYCRGPCNAVSRLAAEKLYQAALRTPLNGQKNEDVFWNGILRTKAGIGQTYAGNICTHLQDKNLRKLKAKSKLLAFDTEIRNLRNKL